MKHFILLFTFFVFLGTAQAQIGNNQIGIGLDLGIPVGDLGRSTRIAPGASLKALYGVGMSGQVGITLGYLHFAARNNTLIKSSSTEIPILASYRQHVDQIYLEPQIGVSLMQSKIEGEQMPPMEVSQTNFSWGIGLGYHLQGIDLSLRYQSASRNGGSRGFIGLRAGYNFNL